MSNPKQAVRNASDAEQVKEARKVDELRAMNWANDIASVMGSVSGRRFVWEVLRKTNVYQSIFVTSSEIYYKAGWQDCGHWLMKAVAKACPADYLLMQQEAARLDTLDVLAVPSSSPSESHA